MGTSPCDGCEAAWYEQIQDRQRRARPVPRPDAGEAFGRDHCRKSVGALTRGPTGPSRSRYRRRDHRALPALFLTVTPPLPRSEQESARLLGRERFDVFIKETAGRKAAHGRCPTRIVTLSAKQGATTRPGTAQLELPQEGPPGTAADCAAGEKGIRSARDDGSIPRRSPQRDHGLAQPGQLRAPMPQTDTR